MSATKSYCAAMSRLLPALFALITASSATEIKLERVPENGVQPQVSVSPDGTVHLVYLTGKPEASDIRYVKRIPKEATWSPPLTVNSEPASAVAVGTIRGAQFAAERGGRIHVVWNGAAKNGQHAAAPLYYARLEDGKFTAQRMLNEGTIHLDGGASVAADDKGRVFVVWHAAPPDGKSEADRRVYIRRSTDHGATFTNAVPAKGVPAGVCACCSLRAFIASDGALLTLYRNAANKTQRDMMLLTSRDGMSEFAGTPVHAWSIAACPMSSAALLASGQATRAVWETSGSIYTSLTNDFTKPLLLSPDSARHPALAVNARGETLVTWSLGTGWKRGGELGWVLLDAAGHPTPLRGEGKEVPVWSHTAAFADAAGNFVILH
jgi:hypothetical protein